jgi:hypothetical protein
MLCVWAYTDYDPSSVASCRGMHVYTPTTHSIAYVAWKAPTNPWRWQPFAETCRGIIWKRINKNPLLIWAIVGHFTTNIFYGWIVRFALPQPNLQYPINTIVSGPKSLNKRGCLCGGSKPCFHIHIELLYRVTDHDSFLLYPLPNLKCFSNSKHGFILQPSFVLIKKDQGSCTMAYLLVNTPLRANTSLVGLFVFCRQLNCNAFN